MALAYEVGGEVIVVIDAAGDLGQFGELADVDVAVGHQAGRLRIAAPVYGHGRPVASPRHVLEQAVYSQPVLGSHALLGGHEVLLKLLGYLRVEKIPRGREGLAGSGHYLARVANHIVRQYGGLVLGRVGYERVGYPGPRLVLPALDPRREGQRVEGLGRDAHLGQLGAYVAHLAHVYRVGHNLGGPGEKTHAACLARARGEPVHGGEVLDEERRILELLAHEHALIGHEDIVADERGLVVAVLLAHVDIVPLIAEHPGVDGCAPQGVHDTVRVRRNGAAYRIGLALLGHRGCRDDHELMAEQYARLVDLGPADHDTVIALLHDPEVHVLVLLLLGLELAVTLDISEGRSDGEILLLHGLEPVLEPLMIVRPEPLIHVIGRGVESRDGLRARASEGAASQDLGQGPRHAGLLHGVLAAHEGSRIEVTVLARQMRLDPEHLLELGMMAEVVYLHYGLERRLEGRVLAGICDLLAAEPDVHRLPRLDGLEILRASHECHVILLPESDPRMADFLQEATNYGRIKSSFAASHLG